jgi:hypothetical protein
MRTADNARSILPSSARISALPLESSSTLRKQQNCPSGSSPKWPVTMTAILEEAAWVRCWR